MLFTYDSCMAAGLNTVKLSKSVKSDRPGWAIPVTAPPQDGPLCFLSPLTRPLARPPPFACPIRPRVSRVHLQSRWAWQSAFVHDHHDVSPGSSDRSREIITTLASDRHAIMGDHRVHRR